MCASPAECGALACVAGRCQADEHALQTAGRGLEIQREGVRRLVLAPTEIAYVRRGDGASSLPEVMTLGRASDGDALLFLRFNLPIPPTTQVLEAYLLLDRAGDADVDPEPVALHAAAIVDPWNARAISWARQPRFDDARATSSTVSHARRLVRIDVRDLVRHWRVHAKSDQGIAVVAENKSATGLAFTLTPPLAETRRDPESTRIEVPTMRTPPPSYISAPAEEATGATLPSPSGPRLEVYVR
jgi:hypothetical protein